MTGQRGEAPLVPKCGRCRRRGLSLLELALAVLVVGLTVGPVYLLIRQGSTGTVQTREEVLAYQAAADVIDAARGLDFGHPMLADGTRECPELPLLAAPVRLDGRFRRTLTVTTETVPGLPYRYKVVQVEVAWQTTGPAQSLVTTGLVFAGGAE